MFGGYGLFPDPRQRDNETEVERLQRELKEALAEIERLRRVLGSNHPDGIGRTFGGLL